MSNMIQNIKHMFKFFSTLCEGSINCQCFDLKKINSDYYLIHYTVLLLNLNQLFPVIQNAEVTFKVKEVSIN